MIRAVIAVAAIILSVVIGSVGAGLLRRRLEGHNRRESLRQVAPAAASFVLWSCVAFGLLIAVSMASPGTLDPMPAKLVAYFPRAVVAGAFVLVGNVAAQLVGIAAGQAALKSTGRANPGLVRGIRTGVLSIGIMMAVSQLGINTTLVNLMAAGVVFGLAASTALLIGLGGRDVATQVAAGRYLRRVLHPGESLSAAGVSGRILAVHPATVELELDGGGRAHVPHARLLGDVIRMEMPAAPEGGVTADDA